MYLWVCLVLELLWDIYIGILTLHFLGKLKAFVHALAYVAVIVDSYNFRTVVTHEHTSFTADRVGHDYDRFISLDCADKRKTDALVSACRFNDNGVFVDETVTLGSSDHIICGTGLDRTAHVKSLKFYKHLGGVFIDHPSQSDERSVAHSFQYIVI